jgi:hypothetical protein
VNPFNGFVLDSSFGLDQGFDLYDWTMTSRRASETGYPERTAGEVTEIALRWLAAREQRFCLWLHYYDPHAAYQPPASFKRRFAGRLYDGEIAYVDEQIERVFRALRRSGEWDRTLVIATADHGESLGEHGERTHAYTLYDAVLKVPLILRGPGVPAARREREVGSAIDLAPTVLRQARAARVPTGAISPLECRSVRRAPPARGRWRRSDRLGTVFLAPGSPSLREGRGGRCDVVPTRGSSGSLTILGCRLGWCAAPDALESVLAGARPASSPRC